MEGDTFSGIGHEMRVLLTHFVVADVLVEVPHRVAAQQRKQMRLRQLIPEHLEPNRGRGLARLPEDIEPFRRRRESRSSTPDPYS